jgi:hypothetical protein
MFRPQQTKYWALISAFFILSKNVCVTMQFPASKVLVGVVCVLGLGYLAWGIPCAIFAKRLNDAVDSVSSTTGFQVPNSVWMLTVASAFTPLVAVISLALAVYIVRVSHYAVQTKWVVFLTLAPLLVHMVFMVTAWFSCRDYIPEIFYYARMGIPLSAETSLAMYKAYYRF